MTIQEKFNRIAWMVVLVWLSCVTVWAYGSNQKPDSETQTNTSDGVRTMEPIGTTAIFSMFGGSVVLSDYAVGQLPHCALIYGYPDGTYWLDEERTKPTSLCQTEYYWDKNGGVAIIRLGGDAVLDVSANP